MARVGSPRSLRIAFGGEIVRVGAPRPSQQGNMCTQHVLLHDRNMCIETYARALFASRSEVTYRWIGIYGGTTADHNCSMRSERNHQGTSVLGQVGP
jgi:hypothetical protein